MLFGASTDELGVSPSPDEEDHSLSVTSVSGELFQSRSKARFVIGVSTPLLAK